MSQYQDELDRLVGELNRVRSAEPPAAHEPAADRRTTGDLLALLTEAAERKASDVILVAGSPPVLRINGVLELTARADLSHSDIAGLALPLLTTSEYATLQTDRSVDLAFDLTEAGRLRANLHYQRGTLAAALRLLPRQVPTLASLGLPDTLARIASLRQGFVLVTGPTGAGKSSTLAAIVDLINTSRRCHVVTIEEPIEFQHTNRQAIIEQIEVGRDAPAFLNSLKSILRQSPDVILVGEMRDPETIATAITAAETGHLVLSTLHTNDTSQAISRIVDSFPAGSQPQIRQQFSLALAAIVAQQLVLSTDGRGRVPTLEILLASDAIRNLIRQGQDHQIRSQVLISRAAGMITMEQSLAELVRTGRIRRETALSHCFRPDELHKLLD